MSQYILASYALDLAAVVLTAALTLTNTAPKPAVNSEDSSAPITAQINSLCKALPKPANLDCAMEILSNEVEIDYN